MPPDEELELPPDIMPPGGTPPGPIPPDEVVELPSGLIPSGGEPPGPIPPDEGVKLPPGSDPPGGGAVFACDEVCAETPSAAAPAAVAVVMPVVPVQPATIRDVESTTRIVAMMIVCLISGHARDRSC